MFRQDDKTKNETCQIAASGSWRRQRRLRVAGSITIDWILRKVAFLFGVKIHTFCPGAFRCPNAALIIRSTCSHDRGDAIQRDPVRSPDRASLANLSCGPTLRLIFSKLPDDEFDQRLIRLELLTPIFESRAHSNSQVLPIR